jgi:hypothetical protein
MKKKFLLLLAGSLFAVAAHAQTTVTTGASSGTQVVYDATSVQTSGTVVFSGTADVSFIADVHVTLAAGFKVAVGALFRAKAGPDVDGDNMPNSWEAANGLNLQVNDAAADPDGDGIPNQTEYQLGTNPKTPGGTPNTADTGNATALVIHKPN